MKKRISGITIELDADTSKLVKKLDGISRDIDKIGGSFEKIGGDLTRNVTLPIAAIGTSMASKYAEVDKTMVLTNETMGNTADQADLLNDAMEQAAANSTYGMNEAATAMLNFARAGLDADQAANALAPAMNLAAGEGGDLDIVSAGLVATINGFHGAFDDAEHYADVFANACNNSALDVDSLSDSMKIAAPVFSAAGYSVEDAALYMGIMANAGIDANEGATALKTGLARLVSPAKEGSEWMEKLGISVTNSDGSMKDSITVQNELHDAFSTLSESEQIAAASAIFGKNQMSKWLALINTAPGEVDSLSESIGVEGTTTEMAEAMMSGFGGSIEKLKSSLDVLMTSMGGLISDFIIPLIEKVQGVIDKFQGLDDETKQQIIKIAGIVAAVGPVLLIIGKVISAIGTVISIISALSAVFSVLSGPVLIVIGVIAALVAIGVLLYKNWDTIKEKAQELWQNLKEKFEFIKLVITQTWDYVKERTSEAFNNIKDKIANSQIGQAASKVWDAMKKTATDAFSAIKKAYDDHGGGLKGAVSATMETIKQYYTAGYNFIDNLTGGKLTVIRDKVSSTFDSIKDKVRSAIDYIKGLFNFSWSLPDIKLPHFRIDGGQAPWGFGGQGYPPQIGIEWYKKAMNNAYMLDGASIFGSMNGKLLGGGETGSEMIIGTNKLLDMIARAKGGEMVFNNQFTINGTDRDPEELAREMSYYLNQEMRRMQYAQGLV